MAAYSISTVGNGHTSRFRLRTCRFSKARLRHAHYGAGVVDHVWEVEKIVRFD
jgi:hypothetical protein